MADSSRKLVSYINSRDPSVDRRCRPVPTNEPIILADLIEISDGEDELSSTSINDEFETDKESACSSSATTAIESNGTNGNNSVVEEALVYLRFRPLSSSNCNKNVYIIDENSLIVYDSSVQGRQKEKHFKFTDVFDDSVGQHKIYDTCINKKIQLEDDLTVLTYGTSGSGKTFTLLGDTDNPGVVPRALEHIFTHYKDSIYPSPAIQIKNGELHFLSDDSVINQESQRQFILSNINDIEITYKNIKTSIQKHHKFETKIIAKPISVFVWISFVEIYNELVYDLLSPEINIANGAPKRKELKVIVNKGKPFLKNVTLIHVKSALEAYTVVMNGLEKVSYASTRINNHSSRSHFLLFIDVLTYMSSGDVFQTFYKFCDLAGSERVGKTGNVGKRLKEAQNINKSLLTLGQCLEVVYKNQLQKVNNIVPSRNSKLTMLLHRALTGREKLTMIVNLMPSIDFFEENLNVLQFSSIAKSIVYKTPKQNKKKSRFSYLPQGFSLSEIKADPNIFSEAHDKLYEENIELRNLVDQLRQQLIAQEVDLRKELCDIHQDELKTNEELWEKICAQKEAYLNKLLELEKEKVKKREKRIHDLEDELDDVIEERDLLLHQLKKKRKGRYSL